MLLIERTVMLIVAGNAHGFFSRSGNKIPFSIDLPNFCRSFREESNTEIKIYMSYDVLVIKEVRKVIEIKICSEHLTPMSYEIVIWMQNRMNCKLCRIRRRDFGFIVVAHSFLQRENLSDSDKVEH